MRHKRTLIFSHCSLDDVIKIKSIDHSERLTTCDLINVIKINHESVVLFFLMQSISIWEKVWRRLNFNALMILVQRIMFSWQILRRMKNSSVNIMLVEKQEYENYMIWWERFMSSLKHAWSRSCMKITNKMTMNLYNNDDFFELTFSLNLASIKAIVFLASYYSQMKSNAKTSIQLFSKLESNFDRFKLRFFTDLISSLKSKKFVRI